MRQYFDGMPAFGKMLKDQPRKRMQASRARLEAVEAQIADARKSRLDLGLPTAGNQQARRAHGLAAYRLPRRRRHLVPAAQPLQSGRQPGRHDQRRRRARQDRGPLGGDHRVRQQGSWPAPGWPGQPENILRVTDLAKRLNIPLVWLVNCSGVKLPDQEQFYARSPRLRHLLLPPRRARAGRDSDSRRHLWGPIRPAAATRASARPSSSPTRTPTSPSAASASSPECRPQADSTSPASSS